jgi:pilus assembly protein CpaF
MSLLDRVQRRAEEPGTIERPTAVPAAADTALAPAPAPSPPLPAAAAPASAPTAPSTPPATYRPASLLTRTGFGARTAGRQGLGLHYALRGKVRQLLVQELAAMQESPPPEAIRQRIAELVNEVAAETATTLPRQDRLRVIETIAHDVLGLGPLEDLLNDESVTEIMVNSASQIYIERGGKLTLSDVQFESNEHLMQVIDRIVSGLGRRVDESSPMVDARLKDGSRVNVIIPPLALRGPTVTIRKFAKDALQVDDLVRLHSMTPEMVTFVRACVRARLNVIVSGGTGSGKTTTLNVLSGFIPATERIVTIEDAAELQLHQDHVVTLETRPPNVEGRGRVTIRDLVINALRMRPDRIVVGECRGGEALDMLQAMNTGHDGSLTTLHANNPHDTISRLETMVLMAGAELPSRAIREQIGSAVQLIVHQSRLRDGTRKVVSVTEVLGADEHGVKLQELFAFRQTGVDENGAVLGHFTATGAMPAFFEHLQTSGEGVPEELFQQRRAA